MGPKKNLMPHNCLLVMKCIAKDRFYTYTIRVLPMQDSVSGG